MKDIQVDLSAPGEVNARMEKPAFLGKGDKGDPGKDGVSVTGLEIREGHLFCRLSNGYSIDAGEFPTPRHWQLSGLNVANQHPISAITGLSAELNDKMTREQFMVYYNTLTGAIGALDESKQDKTDDDLTTTDKTVTGSINEIVDTIGLVVEMFSQSLDDTMSKPGEEVEANRVPVSLGDGRGGYAWMVYTGGGGTVYMRVNGGYIQYSTDNVTWNNLIAVADLKGDKGDKGDKGEQGIQGVQGIQGIPGTPGAKGDKGDKGDQGIQGIQGIQGVPGTPGAKGDSGVYVGSGTVPSGYNVQIDPNGDDTEIVEEAPNDGKQYARNSKAWAEVTGVTKVRVNGTTYIPINGVTNIGNVLVPGDINGKQNIKDNSLMTTGKTIVSAINELHTTRPRINDAESSATTVYSSVATDNKIATAVSDKVVKSDLAETLIKIIEAFETKLNISQGVSHAGEFLVVGSDGNITTRTLDIYDGSVS